MPPTGLIRLNPESSWPLATFDNFKRATEATRINSNVRRKRHARKAIYCDARDTSARTAYRESIKAFDSTSAVSG